MFSVRQDFNGCDCADPQRPLQEIVGFILVYETKAKFVAGKLCVKNSILCARFERYIAFFSIFNNFCKDFYSSIHIVVSAHAFEIISEARENQREYWPGFKFLLIILQRVY